MLFGACFHIFELKTVEKAAIIMMMNSSIDRNLPNVFNMLADDETASLLEVFEVGIDGSMVLSSISSRKIPVLPTLIVLPPVKYGGSPSRRIVEPISIPPCGALYPMIVSPLITAVIAGVLGPSN